jgi:integral membrane sensor domain MASE1
MPLFGGRTRHGDGEQAVVGRNATAIRRATRSVREYWFSSPRFAGKRQDAHAYRALLVMNVLEAALICVSGILVFEMSIKALQQQFSRTVIFPLYLPRAMGIAVAAKHQGSVALGNFIGFYFSRIYMAVRSSNSLGHSRFVAVVLFAILGTCESQIGAWFMKKWLCQQHPRKKEVPTFDNVAQAFSYILIVFSTSLVFETLIAVAECVTSMVEWKYFFRYWGTWWLGVLSAMLSLSPAVIHLMALELPPQPLLHFLLLFSSKKKVMGSIKKLSIKRSFKAVFLWSLTLGLLIMVFLYSVRTFIRPLPYLLFPLIICVAFVFNRVGWSLVVAVSSLFCALGTLHRDSSLYYMAGAPKDKASLSLVLQIELFISVVGLVGIVLAAAVKEKNQLTHDLNQAMEGLEKTVEERTKELVKANEGLQVSQKTAEHASHAKSEFLANMSHEIRSCPLFD